MLYHPVKKNPTKRDHVAAVIDCLIANGAREPGFTKEMLEEELRSGAINATAESEARYDRCSEDPDYVGPVKIDPNWVPPSGPATVITVNPDGRYNTEPPR